MGRWRGGGRRWGGGGGWGWRRKSWDWPSKYSSKSSKKSKSKSKAAWNAAFDYIPNLDEPLEILGLSQGAQPVTVHASRADPIMLDDSGDELDLEVMFGTVRAEIVGIRYYSGTVNNKEMVGLAREPNNKYDRNAVKVTNVMGEQVGHIKRNVAAGIAWIMDTGKARLEGVVPRGSGNTYNIPVDLTFWGRSENKDLVISHLRKSQISVDMAPEDMYRVTGAGPTSSRRQLSQTETEINRLMQGLNLIAAPGAGFHESGSQAGTAAVGGPGVHGMPSGTGGGGGGDGSTALTRGTSGIPEPGLGTGMQSGTVMLPTMCTSTSTSMTGLGSMDVPGFLSTGRGVLGAMSAPGIPTPGRGVLGVFGAPRVPTAGRGVFRAMTAPGRGIPTAGRGVLGVFGAPGMSGTNVAQVGFLGNPVMDCTAPGGPGVQGCNLPVMPAALPHQGCNHSVSGS